MNWQTNPHYHIIILSLSLFFLSLSIFFSSYSLNHTHLFLLLPCFFLIFSLIHIFFLSPSLFFLIFSLTHTSFSYLIFFSSSPSYPRTHTHLFLLSPPWFFLIFSHSDFQCLPLIITLFLPHLVFVSLSVFFFQIYISLIIILLFFSLWLLCTISQSYFVFISFTFSCPPFLFAFLLFLCCFPLLAFFF